MVLLHDHGERIPLTVADYDRERGTVTLVIQAVGKSTMEMMLLNEGDTIRDFIGPLGEESQIEKKNKVVLVGGGLGVAPVFPQLRAFKELGSYTISIIGFRTKELIFWEKEFSQYSDELYVCTDDGSYGFKGFVSAKLQQVLEEQPDVEEVVAIGPLPMMKACCEVTRPFNVKTMVSLNSIMVDGTGMCGCCRVNVGGETKFACVDGPEFDGHQVDFDNLMQRLTAYLPQEKEAYELFQRKCACEAQS